AVAAAVAGYHRVGDEDLSAEAIDAAAALAAGDVVRDRGVLDEGGAAVDADAAGAVAVDGLVARDRRGEHVHGAGLGVEAAGPLAAAGVGVVADRRIDDVQRPGRPREEAAVDDAAADVGGRVARDDHPIQHQRASVVHAAAVDREAVAD